MWPKCDTNVARFQSVRTLTKLLYTFSNVLSVVICWKRATGHNLHFWDFSEFYASYHKSCIYIPKILRNFPKIISKTIIFLKFYENSAKFLEIFFNCLKIFQNILKISLNILPNSCRVQKLAFPVIFQKLLQIYSNFSIKLFQIFQQFLLNFSIILGNFC